MSEFGSKNWLINLLGIVLFLCAAVAVIAQAEFLRSVPGEFVASDFGPHLGYREFQDHVFFPTRGFVIGENPYAEGFASELHPNDREIGLVSPSSLLVHLPFGWFQLRVSEWIYLAVNLAIVLLISWLVFQFGRMPATVGAVCMLAGIMVLCRPGLVSFYTVGMTPVILLGTMLALEYGHRNPWLAGLGLLFVFCNPVLAIGLMTLMFFRGNLEAVVAGVVLGVGSSALALAILNSNAVDGLELANRYTDVGQIWNDLVSEEGAHRVDAWAAIRPWTEELAVNEGFVHLESWLPLILLLVGCGALLSDRNRRQNEGVISRSGVLILALLLAGMNHFQASALMLWPALAALFIGAPKLRLAFPAFVRGVLIVLLLIPLFNFACSEILIERLPIETDSIAWTIATSIDAIAILAVVLIAALTSFFGRPTDLEEAVVNGVE